MKKSARVSATVVAVGLLLSSCGFGGSASDGGSNGGTTLDLLVPSYSSDTRMLWQGMIKDFEAANENINVDLRVESWENIAAVLKTNLQADQAPDIYNGGPFAAFAEEGLLYSATDVASVDTIEDFQDSFVENEKLGGVQYGLPLLASTRALFYNKTLFEQADVSAPPKTWDELHAAAQKIEKTTKMDGYGMPLGSEGAHAESFIWFANNGGGFGDESAITVDTPENLEAAKFMKKMITDGATQPDAGATQRTPMLNVFIQGQIGMAYGLPQTVGQIEEKNPDLDYGIAPAASNIGEPVTLGVADRLMAFKNDGDKQEAITKFMDFFFEEGNYVDWVKAEGFLPTTTKSGAKAMASNETLRPFLELLPDAKFFPTSNPAWNATEGAFKSLVGQIESKDPAAVLQDIEAKADAAAK